jgi:hypothetical protein
MRVADFNRPRHEVVLLRGFPIYLDSLGEEAWQTGCPLCGDQCLQNATESEKKEAEEYYQALEEANEDRPQLKQVLTDAINQRHERHD